MNQVIQHPIPASLDLRDMLRRHLIRRSLACMDAAADRRVAALSSNNIDHYRDALRSAVRGFYDEFPRSRVIATPVSRHDKRGYRLENVLFDSFPGWQVNATVYVPLDFAPPFPAVVIPVGHSGKQFDNYQLPAQFFARCGYVAVLFDPPGQAGEKQPGNDHFTDGARCYLTGQTSSRYFVADALRCIDYLETRNDVDLGRGVAMTGVSGGGTTTTLAGLLDERITVSGLSCCVTRLADLDITQCYAGCPETHMWRRYAEGVDEVDLLCAACPTPTLLMAGEHDEVFRIDDTRLLAEEVAVDRAQVLGSARSRDPQRARAAAAALLLHYDLPELCASLPCTVSVLNPLGAMREALSNEGIQTLNQRAGKSVYCASSGSTTTIAAIREGLGDSLKEGGAALK